MVIKQTRALGDTAFADGDLQPVTDRRGSLAADSADTSALVGDSSFSELVGRMRREFDDLSVPLCEEVLDWLKGEGLLAIGAHAHHSMRPAKWKVGVLMVLEYVFKHPAMTDIFAALYIWDEPLLDDILGHLNPAQFAARIGVTREAVNKAVLRAQLYFKLPPRRGQRHPQARANMKQARMKQLKRLKVEG
jgi:hypothetical protein